MLNVTDLRNGTTFQMDGAPYLVLRYMHTKMGRGTANVRVEARNLKSGRIEEKTFMSNARVENAPTTKKKMQYLYSDAENSVFMDPVTFEQVEIPLKIAQESVRFLKDGETADVMFWKDEALSVEVAPKVNLTVKDTGPGVKGNSATNIWKPATLENGIIVKVPLFIQGGDKIRMDTRTGEYVERLK